MGVSCDTSNYVTASSLSTEGGETDLAGSLTPHLVEAIVAHRNQLLAMGTLGGVYRVKIASTKSFS